MEFDIFINPPEEKGGKWIAFSMAFPGCKGTGNTKEEAIKNFKISMENCIKALLTLLPEESNENNKVL
ncbi:MAG TPA: type II toxin-antitoxin system HicB family antitoxin [Candidatus Eremiobacteraeota bacterium]|nr:MAG: hypothetical protein BWY64_01162 [bacterium ADurb.Bin363]HPZ08679.1 type II toxin-antitoxin system HicB family antitoxin [Candidatus Eremiobacteraeota bacterium]